ncbi:MAG: DUF371 domain-containing protein [Promethearchaeota archaeon]
MNLKFLERFTVHGHCNILGNHKSTIEFTKECHLSKKGDCILGVGSQRSCVDLRENTKKALVRVKTQKNPKFLIKLVLKSNYESFFGFGNKDLKLTDKRDIVFRKSNYICGRTIMISCNKAAKDINRNLIKDLRDPASLMMVEIYLVLEEDKNPD